MQSLQIVMRKKQENFSCRDASHESKTLQGELQYLNCTRQTHVMRLYIKNLTG
jgi:hypothetical protein